MRRPRRGRRTTPPTLCEPSCATACRPAVSILACGAIRRWSGARCVSTSAEADRRLLRTRTEGLALVLFTACSWGLTWPQTKYLMSLLPAFSARAACGVIGCVFAFLVAVLRRERVMPPRDQWLRLTVYAMLNYGLFIVLTTQSLKHLKASEAVTITYTLPVWASLLAWPMLGERPTW